LFSAGSAFFISCSFHELPDTVASLRHRRASQSQRCQSRLPLCRLRAAAAKPASFQVAFAGFAVEGSFRQLFLELPEGSRQACAAVAGGGSGCAFVELP